MTLLEQEVADRLAAAQTDAGLRAVGQSFAEVTIPTQCSYNFFWAGHLIIQCPHDTDAVQGLD